MSQQPSQWIWDARVKKHYYWRQDHNGELIRVYENTAADASSASRPRKIQSQTSHAANSSPPGYQSPNSTSGSYTHQTRSAYEPEVIARQSQALQRQSSGQVPTGAQYENYQAGRDAHGVQSRTVDGPKQAITDPELSAQGIVAHKKLLATDGKQEFLDPEFKVRSPSFYKPGRVFLTLWTEPTSVQANATDVTRVRFNQTVYTKVRRFVVIRPGELSCSAIPILTYTGQGVGKTGLRKYEHAIMYTGKTAPQPLRIEEPMAGERGMMEPVRVVPDQPGAQLDSMSRAHYGKVYTIEANLKVKPFGMIQDPRMLMAQFMGAWGFGQIALPAPGGQSSGATGGYSVRDASEVPKAYIPPANLPTAPPRVQGPSTAPGSGSYAATPGSSTSVPSGSGLPRSSVYAPPPSNAGAMRSPQTASGYNDALRQRQAQAQQAREIELAAARQRTAAANDPATGSNARQLLSSATTSSSNQASEDSQAVSAAAAYRRMVADRTTSEHALETLAEQLRRDQGLSPEAAASRARSLVTRGLHLFAQRARGT